MSAYWFRSVVALGIMILGAVFPRYMIGFLCIAYIWHVVAGAVMARPLPGSLLLGGELYEGNTEAGTIEAAFIAPGSELR